MTESNNPPKKTSAEATAGTGVIDLPGSSPPSVPSNLSTLAPMHRCEHGVYKRSDSVKGCGLCLDAAYDARGTEIERLRAAIMVMHQAILEFSHARDVGPGWYTRGERGLTQQVDMWIRKGIAAFASCSTDETPVKHGEVHPVFKPILDAIAPATKDAEDKHPGCNAGDW